MMDYLVYILKFKANDRKNLTVSILFFIALTLFLLYIINLTSSYFIFKSFLDPLEFLNEIPYLLVFGSKMTLIWFPEVIFVAIFGAILLFFLAVFIPKAREVLGWCMTPCVVPFKPEDCLNSIDFQGKVIKEDGWISITSSDSGMLFKYYYWRDFEAEFIFKFKGEENGKPLKKSHEKTKLGNEYCTENNYLGFVFRARDLDNYFMLSIGVKKFIDIVGKIVYKKGDLLKKESLLITPHVKVGGAWDVFTGEDIKEYAKEFSVFGENRLIIRVEGNTLKLWIREPNKKGNQKNQKKEKENPLFTWNLPTHYHINWGKEKKEDSPGDSSKIPFRSSIGRIGFREYGDEHVLVKDVVITKLC